VHALLDHANTQVLKINTNYNWYYCNETPLTISVTKLESNKTLKHPPMR